MSSFPPIVHSEKFPSQDPWVRTRRRLAERRLAWLWWLAAVAALCFATTAQARPVFRPWDLPVRDAPGLLSPDVLDIDGDAQGRLWIATAEGGASRYDPRDGSWLTFAEGYALHDTQVLDVHVDRRGDVWFATEDDGVHRLDRRDHTWARFDGGDGAVDGGLRIVEDHRGWLWVVGFDAGLSRFEPGRGRWVDLAAEMVEWTPVFHDLVEDAAGTIWAHGLDGLYVHDPKSDQWEAVAEVPREVHAQLSAIHPGPDVGVWLGGWFGGVGWLSGTGGEYRQVVPPLEGATDRQIAALLPTPEGELWVGTYARGFFRIDPETGALDDAAVRRPDEWGAKLLFRDRDGDVWAGSWGTNLRRFDAGTRAWQEQQAPLAGPDADVTAVYEDRQGTLWFGTRGAGVLRRDGRTGAWSQLPLRRDGTIGGDRINGVAVGPDGELWITSSQVMSGLVNGSGVRGGGVHRFDTRTGDWTTYRGEDGLGGSNARDVAITPEGDVLVAGLFGIRQLDRELDRWSTVAYTSYSEPGYVRSLKVAADGRVWGLGDPGTLVGSRTRLDRHWHAPPPTPTFEGQRVRWIAADPAGDLWAGLADHRLARLPRGEDDWLCCSGGTRGRVGIAGMAFSRSGAGWLWSSDGRVAAWSAKAGTGTWREPPDHVEGNYNPGIALVDPEGAAWVGYRNGTVRFDADGERTDVFTGDDGLAGGMADAGGVDAAGALWLVDSQNGATRLVLDDRGPHRPHRLDGVAPAVSPAGLLRDGDGGPAGICWARPSGLMLSTGSGAATTPLSPVRDWTTGVAGGLDGCWAGHFLSGLVFVDRSGEVRRFGLDQGLPDRLVTGLSPVPGTAGSRVWVATNDGAALVDADAGVLHVVTVAEGSSAGVVDRILALPDGGALLVFEAYDRKWFGGDTLDTARAIPHLRRVSAAGQVGPLEPWPGGRVRDLAIDGEGTVWVVTELGLIRRGEGEPAWLPAPLPADIRRVRAVAADPVGRDARIWLAVDGEFGEPASVLVHDPARDSWRTLSTADGLPGATRIDALEPDGRGGVVVLAGGRVVRGAVR
jgi:ligand-binding sensor domain-containing protein